MIVGAMPFMVGGAGARYWRLLLKAGSSRIYIQEIEMRKSVGGPDACTGGSSFGSVDYHARAFDDDPGGYDYQFDTSISYPEHIGYHFTAPIEIAQLSLTLYDYSINDFDVQKSVDGNTWETVASFPNEPNWTAGETRLYQVSP